MAKKHWPNLAVNSHFFRGRDISPRKMIKAPPVLAPRRVDMSTDLVFGRLAGMSRRLFHIGDLENGEH
tara:strand:- start:54712 stop:54915 length:204 start_codon:yes stop_codon:yes gene_type:complete